MIKGADLLRDNRTAIFNEDRTHRFLLKRKIKPGDAICLFAMLNPSKADEEKNDNTVSRCIKFADIWGFSWVWVVNIFSIRSTDPKVLYLTGKINDPFFHVDAVIQRQGPRPHAPFDCVPYPIRRNRHDVRLSHAVNHDPVKLVRPRRPFVFLPVQPVCVHDERFVHRDSGDPPGVSRYQVRIHHASDDLDPMCGQVLALGFNDASDAAFAFVLFSKFG